MQLQSKPNLRVMHLDDDVFFLEKLERALSSYRGSVRLVVESFFDVMSLNEALRCSDHQPPDVIILDIRLGSAGCLTPKTPSLPPDTQPQPSGLDGRQLLKDLRKSFPKTAILMCSDLSDMSTMAYCIQNGADDFLFKGSDDQELARRIHGIQQVVVAARGPVMPLGPGGKEGPSGMEGLSVHQQEVRARFSALSATQRPVGAFMAKLNRRIPRILSSAITAVNVLGESGTGKEVCADLFASHLPPDTPFVRVNCGALSPTLLESELFGHVRGAFTGAQQDRKGLIESANGGWLFLDEISTLSASAQVALLRVLEAHKVRPVGGQKERAVRIRVLSASNEDLQTLVASGKFRGDLYQRLTETHIHLLPLRQRTDEIPALVKHFCKTMAGGPYQVTKSTMEILSHYSWSQGNIRELRNCLRAMTEYAVEGLLTPLSVPSRVRNGLATGIPPQPLAKHDPQENPPHRSGLEAEEVVASAGFQANGGFKNALSRSMAKPARFDPQPDLHVKDVHGRQGAEKNRPVRVDFESFERAPTFELLALHVLWEYVVWVSDRRGVLSMRECSKQLGMSRVTLSTKLKQMVEKELVGRKDMLARVQLQLD